MGSTIGILDMGMTESRLFVWCSERDFKVVS